MGTLRAGVAGSEGHGGAGGQPVGGSAAVRVGHRGRIGREYPENNVSAFKRVKVLLADGTYGYRVVRPDWDAMMTSLRRGEWNALALPNIDRGMRVHGIWKV